MTENQNRDWTKLTLCTVVVGRLTGATSRDCDKLPELFTATAILTITHDCVQRYGTQQHFFAVFPRLSNLEFCALSSSF